MINLKMYGHLLHVTLYLGYLPKSQIYSVRWIFTSTKEEKRGFLEVREDNRLKISMFLRVLTGILISTSECIPCWTAS